MASRQNLELAAARQRRGVTQAEVQIASQRPNPTASVSVLRDTPHESLFFSQPLEIGGKRGRRMDLAREQVGLTEVEIATLAHQVRRSVREAYYAAALARGVTAQQDKNRQLAQRLLDIARARFEAGDVPELEVLQAELEWNRAEADFAVAQQQEKAAFSQLNVVLNVPPETQWELVSSLEDLPPQTALPDLFQRAEESNPDLQHLLQEQEVEKSRGALLRAERIPNLDLEFGTDFNAPPDFRVGPRSQLSLVLPLFSRNQGEIAQSTASLRVLEGETRATQRAVTGRVEAAYLDLGARQTQVELYHRNLIPATIRLEDLAEQSYRAGKASILTVLDAQRNVQQTQRAYLESLFELQTAFARLEEIVGGNLD